MPFFAAMVAPTPPLVARTGGRPVLPERERVVHTCQVRVPYHFPISAPLRDDVPVNVESAPLPVDASAFYNVGTRYPHAMNRPADTRSFAEWLSVMQWPSNLVGRVPSALVAQSAPHQGMTPVGQRVNIARQPQTSAGAQATLRAPVMWAPQYAKLGSLT